MALVTISEAPPRKRLHMSPGFKEYPLSSKRGLYPYVILVGTISSSIPALYTIFFTFASSRSSNADSMRCTARARPSESQTEHVILDRQCLYEDKVHKDKNSEGEHQRDKYPRQHVGLRRREGPF